MQPTRGFFVQPDGHLRLVSESHIGAVIDDPAAFGLELAHIEATYRRHGEALRTEAHARDEILTGILKQTPWVRVREKNHDACRWHLQLAPTPAGWANVQRFADLAMAGRHPAFTSPEWPTTLVRVLGLGEGTLWTGRLADLTSADLPTHLD